jgi:MoaA/NifB/PqqE/SkfB family radical SAM enzyme
LFEWDLHGLDEERGKSEQIFQLFKPDIIKTLDENPDFKKVRFSGGEPFMHPLLLEFLREAKRRGKYTEVLTSGNFYNKSEPLALISASKKFVDKIGISLYGGREIQGAITRNEESFDCLDETVNKILAEKINFSFNFVAMSKNKDSLEEVFRYVHSKKNNYCNPGINILRIINQGFALGEDSLFLLESQINEIAFLSKEFSKQYKVPVSLGCSFARTSCNAGKGKRVFTYNREYFDCSALKDIEVDSGKITENRLLCQERW